MRTPFGELDVLGFSTKHKSWIAVEVKSLARSESLEHRVSRSQRGRLRRIHQWLSEKKGATQFLVAFVDAGGAVIELGLEEF